MNTLNVPLPSGWKWTKLSDLLIALESGSRPKGGAIGIENGVPSISAEQMTGRGVFDFSVISYVPHDFYNDMKRGHIQVNDILIVKDGATTGKTCFVDENFPFKEAVINEHVFICRPNTELIEPLFLFYWLWGQIGQYQIKSAYQGAAIGGINQKFTESVVIPLPSLSEQKRIVKILNEQMAAVENARKAVCDNFNTTNILSSAYLRNIFSQDNLKRWPKKQFGDIAQIIAKQVNPTLPEYRDLPHVNGENIESGTGRLTYLNTAAEELMISGKYLFPKGSVLYSKLRPYLRKVALVDFDGVCSADMYPIRVDSNYLRPDFAAWLLLSDEFTNYAVSESQRARMPKLNRKQLFSWEAPLPTLDEQEEMTNKLLLQMKKTTILNQKIEELVNTIEALPSALLRKAFRGEV